MLKLILILIPTLLLGATAPIGYENTIWGDSPQKVKTSISSKGFSPVSLKEKFPTQLNITTYRATQTVAGYNSETTYFFYNNKLFQVTLRFTVPGLKNYDFNYNVFVSVDKYYREIRSKSLIFIQTIYKLLENKYGMKQPVFKGLDPKNAFISTDNYLKQERWNLRYAPSEYYKRILASAYAKWLYPKTEITFAVNISAPDKRFDYTLSYVSTLLKDRIIKESKKLNSTGL